MSIFDGLTVSYDPFSGRVSTSPPTPATPSPERIAEALKEHAKAGKDLTVVHRAIDEIKTQTDEKERVAKTLKGVAELTKQGKAPRRFIVAYHHNGETGVTHGTEYNDAYVHVNSTNSTPGILDDGHDSMTGLRAKLTSNNVAHHIEYLD